MAKFALGFMILAAALLVGGTCSNPGPEQQAHQVLYILAQPPGGTTLPPSEAVFRNTMQQVADWFFEVSYQRHRVEGIMEPEQPGDLIGPIEPPTFFPCSDFAFTVRSFVMQTLDLEPYDQVIVVSPDPACSLRGEHLEDSLVWINSVALYGIAPYVIQHEVGHVFGLGHSGGLRCPPGPFPDGGCEFGEYLDFIDVMGTSFLSGHYNAFQKEKLGWLDDCSIVEVTESGSYLLMPFESPLVGPKALKIQRQTDSHIYVEYRTPTGFDNLGHPGYSDGAVVRITRRFHDQAPLDSKILEAPGGLYTFQPGEPFEDSRGHRVTVVDKTPAGILLDVVVAESDEADPPEVELTTFPGSSPGHHGIVIDASDASGIDRVDIYSHVLGPSRFDWSQVSFVTSLQGSSGSDPVHVETELDLSGLLGSGILIAVIYDGQGNVTRKLAGSYTPAPPPTEPNLPPFLFGVTDNELLTTVDPLDLSGHWVGGFGEELKLGGLAFDAEQKVLYGVGRDGGIYTIDVATRTVQLLTSIPNTNMRGLAYDASQGRLFAASFLNFVQGSRLYFIDPATLETGLVGSVDGYPFLGGLAYDPNGDVLYGTDGSNNTLISINRDTAEATPVVQGLEHAGWNGLAFDPERGVLLATRTNLGLTEIDPATGSVTDVGTISGVPGRHMLGLAYCPGPSATDCE